MKALILGAGRGVNLPTGGPLPKCLLEGLAGWRVLDWLLNALRSGGGVDEIVFVGGDGIDRIREAYPELRYVFNENWARHHVIGSLFAAESELDSPFYFSYSDTVYRPDSVRALREAQGEVAIVVDRAWRSRYAGRGPSQLADAEKVVLQDGRVRRIGKDIPLDEDIHGEFIGLARFGARGAAALRSTYHTLAPLYQHRPYRNAPDLDRGFLSDLLQELILQGMEIEVVSIDGDWAELDMPEDLAHFVFGTKAETLERLAPLVHGARVVEGVRIQVGDWQRDPQSWARELSRQFSSGPIAVRSSALAEDAAAASMAGRYESIIGVEGGNVAAIHDAVEKVVASYAKDGSDPGDQILVQHCLTDVAMSGVMMTRDLDTGADYTVIHYDDAGERTDTVTAGGAAETHAVQIYRGTTHSPSDPRLAALLGVAGELEAITGTDALDVEFAFTRDGTLHVLQVRPIAASQGWIAVDRDTHRRELDAVRDHLRLLLAPAPGLAGATTVLGQMPDWNPAEMIGSHPAPLARSLYERLITDRAWRQARASMGYGDAFPHRLMVSLAGRPYVDVRCSANNLLPAALPWELRARAIDAGLRRLREHPELHDKIEFEVFPTCLDLGIDRAMGRLLEHGLLPQDVPVLQESLRALTERIVNDGPRRIDEALSAVDSLTPFCDQLLATTQQPEALPRAIALLIDGTIERGTIPFSVLARQSFVGTALLRSLRDRGVIEAADLEAFVGSVRTISGELMDDLGSVHAGHRRMEDFLQRYGHLRPGSYDILSPRYDSRPDLYFPETRVPPRSEPVRAGFENDRAKRAEIDELLDRLGLGFDSGQLFSFARRAIAGRERAKFGFTRNLSAALELIARWGESLGLRREEMAQLEIDDILRWSTTPPPPRLGDMLVETIARARMRRTLSSCILLPSLITSEDDLETVRRPAERPNFVSAQRVHAPITLLHGTAEDAAAELSGRIVLIEGADPGYDWIFTREIAGLITCYGGANSHMTIRCAEFGLPAAIGCGPALYGRLGRATSLLLDCEGESIRVD